MYIVIVNTTKLLGRLDSQHGQFPSRWNHQRLENLGFKGVTYKHFYFEDPINVENSMIANMNHPSHGFFVDIVSFIECFGNGSYIERNKTLNELYMSNKIGYGTKADSIMGTSFNNILPTLYGKCSTGSSKVYVTAQVELSGMKTFEKWDVRNGISGRKYWIKDETRKTEIQFDNWIRTQLTVPAQVLACDLLNDSHTMSHDLYIFISTPYEYTMHSGKSDSNQAWKLTSSYAKQIFTEIGHSRVSARDDINTNAPWSSGANILFATLHDNYFIGK